jgi:hypothetical protein
MVLLFLMIKNLCLFPRTRAVARGTTLFRRSIRPTNRGSTILMRAITGHNRNTLPRCIQRTYFRHSTSESRSRATTERGSHPVTPVLWRSGPLYSTRSMSFAYSFTRIPLTVRFVNCFRQDTECHLLTKPICRAIMPYDDLYVLLCTNFSNFCT